MELRTAARPALQVLGSLISFSTGVPALTAAVSLVISLWVYAAAFDWGFSIGFIGLLLAHETGHVLAACAVGLRPSFPLFIPFLGAVISLRRPPVSARMEANVAIGGPAMGALSALSLLTVYFWTGDILMLMLAYTAGVLNLFNLIPCMPLDGGKIADAISPRFWWIGSAATGMVFFVTLDSLVLFFAVMILVGLKGMQHTEPGVYYRLRPIERIRLAGWYIILLVVLGMAMACSVSLLH